MIDNLIDWEMAPIMIPTLCRFEHFKSCVESLAKCNLSKETDLYVSLDYPTKESHWDGYRRIKEYLEDGVSGFRKVYVYIQDKNLGAVGNWKFLYNILKNKYLYYIATEDDNVFSEHFLQYINEGLKMFINDEKDTPEAAVAESEEIKSGAEEAEESETPATETSAAENTVAENIAAEADESGTNMPVSDTTSGTDTYTENCGMDTAENGNCTENIMNDSGNISLPDTSISDVNVPDTTIPDTSIPAETATDVNISDGSTSDAGSSDADSSDDGSSDDGSSDENVSECNEESASTDENPGE